MSKWISVKESLPTHDISVLGVNRFEEMAVVSLKKFWTSEDPEWRLTAYEVAIFFPTHWMPLPEPPDM